MTRTLLIACSARKHANPGLMPAVDRYDGPWYRTLHKYMASHPADPLDVWIISAEFGLIHGSTPIPDYNRQMTMNRAAVLVPQIRTALRTALDGNPETMLCAGKVYVNALRQCQADVPHIRTAKVPPGGIGTKMGHLKRWLYGVEN